MRISMASLYKHVNSHYHRLLGYGFLVEKVSLFCWKIRWINTGRIVKMHPHWLEAIYEDR